MEGNGAFVGRGDDDRGDMSCDEETPVVQRVKGTEDFECPLCMKIFYEPVTTPCGHTFCRFCLTRALDHGQACPLCRNIMHLSSEPPVTVVLQKLIEKNFPSELSARKEEMLDEKSVLDVTWSDQSLPLFPLKHVAFPGMTFPLHIFEPKYRLMIRRCMAGSRCFGIVNVHMSPNGSWVPYNVGTMVTISKTTILMDGRSIIHCKGLRRFRIQQKWDQDGYLVGRVECYCDGPVKDEERETYAKNVLLTRQMVQEIIANEGRLESLQKMLGQAGEIPINDIEFSFWVSSLLPISPVHKQELLETTSTAWRFTRLLYIIGRVTHVLQHGDYQDHSEFVQGNDLRRDGADGDGTHGGGSDGADGTGRDDMELGDGNGHPAQQQDSTSPARFPAGPQAAAQGGDGLGPRALVADGLGPRALGADGLGPRALGADGLGPRALVADGLGPRALVADGLGPQPRAGQANDRIGPNSGCYAS